MMRALLLAVAVAANAQAAVSFADDIRPLLESRCLKCHGAAMQLGKLDLRQKPAAPVLVPGKPEDSSLYARVAGLQKPLMPMDGTLTAAEVAKLREWIAAGAEWSGGPLAARTKLKFWSFETPVRAALPASAGHPVDALLAKARAERGLVTAPRANDATLVRRAYLDLLGLPPTPDQVAAFVNDHAADRWPRLIDALLASPHYGERWGRHWLDVARYADSSGYEHDFDRPNAWRYRDYVIGAFNTDKPYNRFLLEQFAGDEIDNVTHDSLIATGFLRQYAKVDFREKSNPQFRYDYLDDMIATIGRGILGLTVQCARCHDHKFDPIPQADYYRLQAALWPYVEVDHPLVPEAQAKAWRQKTNEVNQKTAALQAQIREIEFPHRQKLLAVRYQRFPANIQEAVNTPEEKRTPGQRLLADQIIRTVTVSVTELDKLLSPEEKARKTDLAAQARAIEKERPAPIPLAAGITDGDYRFAPDGQGDEPAPGKARLDAGLKGSFLHEGPGPYQPTECHFLKGGDASNQGPVAQPGFVTVATKGEPPTALPPAHGRTTGRRRALAEWLGSRENPLTARVMVNRIWNHHFGRGLVASLDNFGNAGERPTHPELLDWLAVEFMDQGWSMKQMHRLMMTSEAYQLSSGFAPEVNLAQDADNRFLWRFRAQRLEAEIVRDQLLAVAGSLNAKQFGPAVFPVLSDDVLRSMNKGIWQQKDEGPGVWRRSVYVYRKRGLPFPFFEVFDLPDQNSTCGGRTISTVATQALTLMNNDFVLTQSRRFAERVEKLAPGDRPRQVRLAFALALGREPDPSERDLTESFSAQRPLTELTHVLLNLNEFLYLR